MARDSMPTLGKSRSRSLPRNLAVIGLAAGLVTGAILWRRSAKKPPPPAPVAATAAPAVAQGGPASDGGSLAAAAPPPKPPAPPKSEEILKRAGYRRMHAVVNGPLETAIVQEVGRELGPALTQVVVRTLVWWIEVPAGLRRGDVLDVLLEDKEGDPTVDAVRFVSEKTGQTHRAYRYKAPGAAFARYYQADGQELELRLKDGPIEDYEQVTSLLRDGRGHQGVDFKTPVGTKVVAPFDGTIERKNWKPGANGNSLELRESGGRHRIALFLHLSETAPEAKVGAQISRGSVIAQSGNTGHSFAPHLHYQLEASDGTVLDPFASHETLRRALPDAQKAAFEAEVKKLDALLDLPL
jgi:murein DD-endopeptidase MepM/ murein hydrolase activator NlpD